MSFNETDLVERLHAVAAGFEMPPAPLGDDVHRGRQRVRRNRVLVASAAAAAVAVVLGVTTAVGGPDRAGSDDLDPVERPSIVLGDGPVWYDAEGLHRGDVVEQTPVEILQPELPGPEPGSVYPARGALALVRTGAIYLDPATGDVWFHPWGGEPRIVGHNSDAGPGGDPSGDIGVWFEGSDALNATPGELVIYNTATGREISRTPQEHGVGGGGGDHYPAGNGFLQVSAERVVWNAQAKTYIHDVGSGTTSMVKVPKGHHLIDVHDEVEVLDEGQPDIPGPVVRTQGRAEERYPNLETHLRLSPSGNYVLAVESTHERHAAAIVDTRTGELWRVPKNAYPWIAWSYGDIALVDVEDAFLACDASGRECDVLDADRPFLMPTN